MQRYCFVDKKSLKNDGAKNISGDDRDIDDDADDDGGRDDDDMIVPGSDALPS